MLNNSLIFLSGMLALSAVQYLACWGYLWLSKKIRDPLSLRGQSYMWIMWLGISVLICTIGILGVKLVVSSEVSLHRGVGAIPMVLGMALSFYFFKTEWAEFNKRFQKKK